MSAQPVTVLMVDDDEEDIFATMRAFQHARLVNDFRSVTSGEALFKYLENTVPSAQGGASPRPHIILLDINMPVMNGFQVLEKLRGDSRFMDIPVVMLTTSSTHEDVVASYRRGVNSYICKPVGLDGMIEIADRFEGYWFQLVKLPARSE